MAYGIYDARTLGKPKMLLLGFQHMFAMFGATVLVPALTGLSVSATLLFAGLGTILFHLLTKMKVPAFLGSSFAFIGGYAAVVEIGFQQGMTQAASLPYACVGVFFAGFMYLILAALFKVFGVKRVLNYFPPVVTGPIIIAIGLTLSGSALNNCQTNWLISLLAVVIILVCNLFGKNMIRIIPVLLGVVGSYVVAAICGLVDFTPVKEAAWIGVPFQMENTAFSILNNPNWGLVITAIITIVPISLATMIEHIGDMIAISSTTKVNYLDDPGLHRTLMGDGLATALASLFGAPANTTYGENTGVLNLTKVFDPRVIRIAAFLAIIFSFCPKFAAVVTVMPAATIGGVSLVLYGMISAVGVRNLVEHQVDLTYSRNLLITALILVLAIGIQYGPGSLVLGKVQLSGLAVAALVGIILNAVLPGNDYEFGVNKRADVSVNLGGSTRNPNWHEEYPEDAKLKK